jgi:ribonuclease BN (tRNA processing enzyme)
VAVALALFALLLTCAAADQSATTKVVLLGTGNPGPTPEHSGPATAIVVGDRAYLVDFGPGVVRRAAAAAAQGTTALAPTNLTIAFLTHLHSDHTAGYPDLIFTPWVIGRKELNVYGPEGLEEMTKHVLEAWREDIEIRTKGLERVQGRQSHGHGFPGCSWGMGARIRISLRHAWPEHRHFGRHQPKFGVNLPLPAM